MKKIYFPSKKYIKKCKIELNKDNDINVVIRDKKKILVLKNGMSFLDTSLDEKNLNILQVVVLFVKLFGFLVVHFYACGCGYKFSYNINDVASIEYKKII